MQKASRQHRHQVTLRRLVHNARVSCLESPKTPVQKVIWFVASHFARDIDLGEAANVLAKGAPGAG
ncbi:hypothetical protein [Aminobacter sp. HY435]|uniref:hypothetical protein n=1 Tax=Aminobacter sp. HY435 TaxID=2970917 RepID=UPI0022B9AAF8|nr:hypothetical protein [Aminobacter sp. HY435]